LVPPERRQVADGSPPGRKAEDHDRTATAHHDRHLTPRLREPPGRPTKIPKTRVPGRPIRTTFQDRGSLAGDVSLAILSQRASATAKRDRDPGDPTDMRVPRPERLPRHSYSESRFRPWLHRLSPPLTQRLRLCVRRPAVPPLQKVADNVRPVRPVRMKVHHGLPSFRFTRTTPDVLALEALGPFPA
jgi:hypothetical protein